LRDPLRPRVNERVAQVQQVLAVGRIAPVLVRRVVAVQAGAHRTVENDDAPAGEVEKWVVEGGRHDESVGTRRGFRCCTETGGGSAWARRLSVWLRRASGGSSGSGNARRKVGRRSRCRWTRQVMESPGLVLRCEQSRMEKYRRVIPSPRGGWVSTVGGNDTHS